MDPETFSQWIGEAKQFGELTLFTGKGCAICSTLPIVVQLAVRCENATLMEALVMNGVLGGETATRAMALATLLAPVTGLPDVDILRQMKHLETIQTLINKLQ